MGFQGSLSFPANPVINQTVDYGGKTFKWTGKGWRQIKPAGWLVNPPGLELIAAGSANNVAVLNFVLTSFTARYRSFTWKLSNLVPVTDANSVRCRFSTDGGTSYAATGYNWAAGQAVDTPNTFAAGSGSDVAVLILCSAVLGNLTSEGMSVSIDLFAPKDAAQWTKVFCEGVFIDNVATPGARGAIGGGSLETAQDTDAVQFSMASGNILSVDYALYGWIG